jgi:iron complex outermembrane receptor protein
VPEGALTTDGYTMLDLSFVYTFEKLGPFTPALFLRLSNLLDQDARDAASFLKDIAPLPGRSIGGGMRMRF